MSIEQASQYILPFEYVQKKVFPMRKDTKRERTDRRLEREEAEAQRETEQPALFKF